MLSDLAEEDFGCCCEEELAGFVPFCEEEEATGFGALVELELTVGFVGVNDELLTIMPGPGIAAEEELSATIPSEILFPKRSDLEPSG